MSNVAGGLVEGGRSRPEGGVCRVASHIPTAEAVAARPLAVIDRADIELSDMKKVLALIRRRTGYSSFGLHRPFVLGDEAYRGDPPVDRMDKPLHALTTSPARI